MARDLHYLAPSEGQPGENKPATGSRDDVVRPAAEAGSTDAERVIPDPVRLDLAVEVVPDAGESVRTISEPIPELRINSLRPRNMAGKNGQYD